MNQDRADILARFRKEMAMMALIVLVSMVLSFVCFFGFGLVLEPRIAEFAYIELFVRMLDLTIISVAFDFGWVVWKLDQAVEDFGKQEGTPLSQRLLVLHREQILVFTEADRRLCMELIIQVVLVLVEIVFAHSAYSAAILVESLILLAIQRPMLRRFSEKLEDELPGMAE